MTNRLASAQGALDCLDKPAPPESLPVRQQDQGEAAIALVQRMNRTETTYRLVAGAVGAIAMGIATLWIPGEPLFSIGLITVSALAAQAFAKGLAHEMIRMHLGPWSEELSRRYAADRLKLLKGGHARLERLIDSKPRK